ALPLAVLVAQTPIVTSSAVVFASTTRDVIGSARAVAQETFHVETSAAISADLAQFGDVVFVPTIDSNMVAVEGLKGRILWRFTADAGITERPSVIGNDIFVVSLQGQFYRVDREVGETAWRDSRGGERFVPATKSFVAANDRYVYTIDTAGELTVVDRARGTVLQRLN